MMSGDNPLLELLEVNNSPAGIADWLENHPNTDINSEINHTTVFYHLLERPEVQVEAVEAFINIPGIMLQRICEGKQQDIPLIHYITSYKYENDRKISKQEISVLKLLIAVTDDINIGDVNIGEAALVNCLQREMFPFAKALLEAEGIHAHVLVNGEMNGIITMLVQTLIQTDNGFRRQWDAEREDLYQLLFHKQVDINDKQLEFFDAKISSNYNQVPLFHFLIYTDIQNINKFDKLKAICSRKDFNPNIVDTNLRSHTALMAVLQPLNPNVNNKTNTADRKSMLELLDILLKNDKLDVNLTDNNDNTALLITENVDAEKLLLKHDKIDINFCVNGRSKLRELLLRKEIDYGKVHSIMQHPLYDVNRVYRDGKTDLIWAISNPRPSIEPDTSLVSFFLKSDKVDISVTDKNGKSALYFAAQNWDCKVIKLLTEHPSYNKSMLNVIAETKRTFLHYISIFRNPFYYDSDLPILKNVIHQADINVQDEDGYTPLMRAIENNENPYIADIVCFFFSHPDKWDLSIKNKYRETALDVLSNIPTVNNRVKSLILDYAGKRGKNIEEYFIADHIQAIQVKISESGLTSNQKEQLKFMLNSFEGVFESLSSGGELDPSAAVRTKLMDNYWFILENIEVGEVIVHLFSKEVITENELQIIREEKTRMYKASKLMEILLCRGERCYNMFVQALTDTYQQHIVDEINRPKSSPSREVVSYASQALTIPVTLRRKTVTAAVTFQFEDSD